MEKNINSYGWNNNSSGYNLNSFGWNISYLGSNILDNGSVWISVVNTLIPFLATLISAGSFVISFRLNTIWDGWCSTGKDMVIDNFVNGYLKKTKDLQVILAKNFFPENCPFTRRAMTTHR